jgi:hypothetical protein
MDRNKYFLAHARSAIGKKSIVLHRNVEKIIVNFELVKGKNEKIISKSFKQKHKRCLFNFVAKIAKKGTERMIAYDFPLHDQGPDTGIIVNNVKIYLLALTRNMYLKSQLLANKEVNLIFLNKVHIKSK